MAAPRAVVDAVQLAIVASAHMTAYEHVAAAAEACRRLGSLTSGRWRAVARDLSKYEEELESARAQAAESVAKQAHDLGVHDEALWTAGDAAATLDLLREDALDELETDSRAARVLQGEVLFGAAFVEDAEVPDRGTTLMFGWPEPLAPATWPWQTTWIANSDRQDDQELREEELELFETGELEGEGALLDALASDLSCSEAEARTALREAAMAITRASLLAGEDDTDVDDDGNEDEVNGER